MANKVGPLIKEARTAAKLSQTALAEQLDGVTAADIGKAERGEKELSQSTLRQIAKLTGVTQSSLLNAAKESTYTAAAKTTSSGAKKSATEKKSAAASDLTAAEKKLVELYRAADAETKKKAVAVLKGEANDAGDLLTTLIGSAIDIFGKK
jgi:transcriptional regulator with XRE-family HTH domain